MRHSIQQLMDTAHEYFPRGILPRDPGYEQTPEWLRQKAARVGVVGQYQTWRALLRRLEARFAGDQSHGVEVRNQSLFLQAATSGTPWDRCFTGQLPLPCRTPNESAHYLEFLVSFVVPYYAIRSERHVRAASADAEPRVEVETSFELSPDEVPFAETIAEEIERSFPGHERMPPDIGLTVVPDVQAGSKWFGEATLFTCLFSDTW